MILCLCNRISDRQVEEARRNGAASADDVFRSRGCEVQCGSCIPMMDGLLVAEPEGACAFAGAAE
jgi:bacterioferritin-associated ferredoxin